MSIVFSFDDYDLLKTIARSRLLRTGGLEFAKAAQSWYMVLLPTSGIVESKDESYSRLNTRIQK